FGSLPPYVQPPPFLLALDAKNHEMIRMMIYCGKPNLKVCVPSFPESLTDPLTDWLLCFSFFSSSCDQPAGSALDCRDIGRSGHGHPAAAWSPFGSHHRGHDSLSSGGIGE